jgi:hypothetical protein
MVRIRVRASMLKHLQRQCTRRSCSLFYRPTAAIERLVALRDADDVWFFGRQSQPQYEEQLSLGWVRKLVKSRFESAFIATLFYLATTQDPVSRPEKTNSCGTP